MRSSGIPESTGCLPGDNRPGPPRISWHDPGIGSAHVDSFRISATRDEIVLVLGLKRAQTSATQGLSIRVSDRIILAPSVARRLLAQLTDSVRAYESAYGPLDATPIPPTSVDRRPPLRLITDSEAGPAGRRSLIGPIRRSAEGVEKADEKASRLYALVHSLNVRVAFERSFKLVEYSLLPDRFLMAFKRARVRQGLDGDVLDICRQIEMPAHYLDSFRAQLPEATIVLFGFEKSEKDRVYKTYLEFGGRLEAIGGKGAGTPEPILLHLGLKWDASDNTRSRMTRYTCIPDLAVHDIVSRIWEAFYRQRDPRLMPLVKSVVDLAATRVGPRAFLYFEAAEETNPQASFDVNLYRANLRIEEAYPYLVQMGRHYAIPSRRLHEVYEPVKGQLLGHLRGGCDSRGRDFLTIYFREEGCSG